MPYYFFEFNRYLFIGSCIHAWGALVICVNSLYPPNSESMSLLFYAVIPLICYYGYVFIERRRSYLRDECVVSRMTSEMEVECIISLFYFSKL